MIPTNRTKFSRLAVTGMLLLLAACTADEPENEAQPEEAAVAFRIGTRGPEESVAGHIDFKKQEVRLYLAEDKQEEQGLGNIEQQKNHLHIYLTGSGFYQVTEGKDNENNGTGAGEWFQLFLHPQRYRFAFLCLPKGADGNPIPGIVVKEDGKETCDYNALQIDYSKLMATSQTGSMPDGTAGQVYRKVITRWLKNGETLRENVKLTRLNGQLLVDMGVLQDQFEHRVTSVSLVLQGVPQRVYLSDDDRDTVKVVKPLDSDTYTYESPVPEETWKDLKKHHLFSVNLLPGKLNGKLVVEMAEETPREIPLTGLENGAIHIKANTITRLEYNGVPGECFDVKYAGFTETANGTEGDSQIDVNEEWNGWQEK